jgi:hypothetical protein
MGVLLRQRRGAWNGVHDSMQGEGGTVQPGTGRCGQCGCDGAQPPRPGRVPAWGALLRQRRAAWNGVHDSMQGEGGTGQPGTGRCGQCGCDGAQPPRPGRVPAWGALLRQRRAAWNGVHDSMQGEGGTGQPSTGRCGPCGCDGAQPPRPGRVPAWGALLRQRRGAWNGVHDSMQGEGGTGQPSTGRCGPCGCDGAQPPRPGRVPAWGALLRQRRAAWNGVHDSMQGEGGTGQPGTGRCGQCGCDGAQPPRPGRVPAWGALLRQRRGAWNGVHDSMQGEGGTVQPATGRCGQCGCDGAQPPRPGRVPAWGALLRQRRGAWNGVHDSMQGEGGTGQPATGRCGPCGCDGAQPPRPGRVPAWGALLRQRRAAWNGVHDSMQGGAGTGQPGTGRCGPCGCDGAQPPRPGRVPAWGALLRQRRAAWNGVHDSMQGEGGTVQPGTGRCGQCGCDGAQPPRHEAVSGERSHAETRRRGGAVPSCLTSGSSRPPRLRVSSGSGSGSARARMTQASGVGAMNRGARHPHPAPLRVATLSRLRGP